MRFHRHVLRDVFVLTLPIVAILGYVVISAALSFYRAEVACFHGYPVRSLRAGGFKAALDHAVAPLTNGTGERYRPTRDRLAERTNGPRVYDVYVRGEQLDRLRGDLPASAKSWVSATMRADGSDLDVDIRNRGQRMVNYFWPRKAWKIRTPSDALVDGYRVINLSPLLARLDAHISYLIGRDLGLSVPRSRVAQLYLNEEDHGLYLQEEQVDESLVRRYGRMPGDIFYGELFVPDEPTMSADDLFWNPFLWRKKAVHNYFGDEHRPHLTQLLDEVTSDEPESFDFLYELFDMEHFLRYLAVLTFQGDQHVDHSHNHKLYFSPLSGKFEPLMWNPLLNMPAGHGVESTANRLFAKVARDPRFLDRLHAIVAELIETDATQRQVDELERIRVDNREYALDRARFESSLDELVQRVRRRGDTVRRHHEVADVTFVPGIADGAVKLDVYARSVASLRLIELRLESESPGFQLWEDRDFDGVVGDGDRSVPVRIVGNRVVLEGDGVRLYPGRDFRAPYHRGQGDSFAAHRNYTRLAFLRTPLLATSRGAELPKIEGLQAERTLGDGPVSTSRGFPDGELSDGTVHPWTLPSPVPGHAFRFSGKTLLEEDVVIRAEDSLEIEPGTQFQMAAGVSLIIRCRVELRNVSFSRKDPSQPWGVVALQGEGASGSVLDRCHFYGGSHATQQFIYYSGMFSVHEAHDVVLRDCTFGPNVFGDDTIRFARCKNLRIEGAMVDRANGDAIDCDLSTGRIERATITDARNDGIDLMTANVDVYRAEIIGCGDKGVSFGEGANPVVADSSIENCVLGVGLKDGSDPVLRKVSISGCRVAIAGYDKNWRYPGGGRGRFLECRFQNNESDIRLDTKSRVVFVGCEVKGPIEIATGGSADQVEVLTLDEAKARSIDEPRFRDLFKRPGR